MIPLPRLISLKNESIEIIRAFAPSAYLGPLCHGTHKGTVAHVRPPADSVERMAEPAEPGWLVFPRWRAGAEMKLEPIPKDQAFLMVATNAFNYEVLGQTAFELVARLVRTCDCYTLEYSDLDQAIRLLDELANGARG